MPLVEFQGTLHEFPDTFTDEQIGTALKRHATGESLRGQQAAARSEWLPRLAGLMPAPSAAEAPAGIYRDMEQGLAPTQPAELPRAPRVSAQDMARAGDYLKQGLIYATRDPYTVPDAEDTFANRLAPDVTPGPASKIAAGVQQAAAGLADPEGLALMGATAGLGALPQMAQRAASAGFAGWMAANAGTQAADIEQAIRNDDVEGMARATAGLGMDTLFAGMSAKHALQGIAAKSPRVADWLSKKVAVQDVPPAEVKAAYNRLERGMGTEADADLVRMVNQGFDRPGQAFRQGLTVEESSPRMGPGFREWLGVPDTTGARTVRLRDGSEPAATTPPITPSAPRPAAPRLLRDAELPPEQLKAEAETLNSPAKAVESPTDALTTARENFPSWTYVEWNHPDGRLFHGWVAGIGIADASPGVSKGGFPVARVLVHENGGEGQVPVEQLRRSSVRGEAAMETRPAAGWTPDGPREPAVSPDLAETIQALREGYVPKVEAQSETSNVQRSTSIPDLPTFVAQAIAKEMAPDVNVELVRRRFGAAEAANAKSSKPTATEAELIAKAKARAEQQGWDWSEVLSKVQQQLGLDADFLPKGGNDAIQLAAMRKQDALAADRAKRFDASLADSPNRPDQSGRPTELTPPAKAMEQGFKNIAARQEEAHRRFVSDAVEQFGVTPEQARAALNFYKQRKWAKLDSVNGRFDLKAGNLWEAEAIREAARQGEPKPAAQPGVAPTGAEPPAQPGGEQSTLAQSAADAKPKKVRVGKSLASRLTDETQRVGDDIISFIHESGGMLSKAAAKAQGKDRWSLIAPEYDDARPLALPWHNLIYRGMRTPDKVAQAAFEAGKLSEPSVPELWQAISDASRRRRSSAGTASREERFIQEEAAAHERWAKATATGKFTVTNEQLGVGDVLDVDGVKVEVTARDPETGRLTLQDGREFETQFLEDGQSIHVESWVEKTPQGEKVVDDWDQPEAAPEPAEPKVEAVPENRQTEAAVAAQLAPAMRDLNGRPTGWSFSRNSEGGTLISPDGKQMVKFWSGNPRSGADAQRQFALAQMWAIENPLRLEKPQGELVVKPVFDQTTPRKLTKAEGAEYSELEDKRRAAQEGGAPLTLEEAKRYQELTALAGQQELLAESGASSTAGRVATLQAKLAEVERLQGMASKRLYESKSGSNAREMTMQEVRGYSDAAAQLRAEIDQIQNGPKVVQAEPDLFGGSGHASVGEFRAPVPARAASVPAVPANAAFADSGLFVDGVEVRLGGSGAVNPVLMPEVYRLFNELTGGDSPFLRRYRRANGMFYPEGAGRIGLHPDLFKFPHQVAYTFAHEFGHLGDYLPDRTMDRGNIFGSIGSLRHWLTTTFPLDPKTSLDDVIKAPERKKLYSKAYQETKRALGPRPDKEESEVDWAIWGNELSKRYQEMVEEIISERGLVPLKQVRDELLTLTQWWKPYDPAKVPESYRKYRESARELYADALSVLFNSPGHLEQMAPTFYKMFWSWLETKPDLKAALGRVQELISRGDAEVLRARLADDKADFAKGQAAFEAAHAEQERSFWDVKSIAGKLMRQLVDRGAELSKLVAGERAGGVLPTAKDARELWEQSLMADNLGYKLMSAVAEQVVKPLHAAGLDPNVDLGIYLKHSRIQGNKSARQELDAIKARLGQSKYLLAEKFADLMDELVRKGVAETQMIDKVILPAESAGIDFEDLTDINRLKLEQGTRVDIANPRLVQAAESERTLAQHMADLGPEKARVLEQAAAAFRDLVFNQVEEGYKAGLFTDRQMQVAAANRNTYAAFRPLDHVDTWVSWAMRRAKGSPKPIENPFVTTLLKMQSLTHATLENRAKQGVRDAAQRVDPESFAKAETYWSGRGQQAKPPAKGMERIIVREEGKPVAYDVDPAIAEAFKKLTPFEQDTAAAWVNWFFHQTLYKGYVSWSLPFNFWTNPNRDINRTYHAMGAVFGKRAPSAFDLARAYKDAWADAKKYVRGELSPLAQEALDFYAIYAPTDAFYSQFPQDDPSHAMFAKLGLVAEPTSTARKVADKVPVLKQALALGDWVTQQGQEREAVGKLGAWLALKRAGIVPEQAAPFVRNFASTPNTKVSGSASAVPNALLPFFCIAMQGWRTSLQLTTNPTTRGGFFFRWAITKGMLRALLTLAGLGYLGKEMKDWIDGVPEYDRTRGVPVPVPPMSMPGVDYGKKSLYLRLPDDEFSAALGYSLDLAMRTAAGQKDAGTAAGQAAKQWLNSVPSLNPFIDQGAQWSAFLTGGVPKDEFRNRPVLTEAERKAGGLQAWQKMGVFSLDKAGVPFLRPPGSEPASTAEGVLRFTPLMNSMFKISDGGFREKDMEQHDAIERVKYAMRMGYGDNTKALLEQHARLERAGAARTLTQEADHYFLKGWHSAYQQLDQAIIAQQQAHRPAEAKALVRDLETLSERVKATMDRERAVQSRIATERAVPWSPRYTNAVPMRR